MNPALVAVTEYSPTGRPKTRYRPESSVVTVRTAEVSMSFVVIVAPGTRAPEGSLTIPVILLDIWACEAGIASVARIREHTRSGNRRSASDSRAKIELDSSREDHCEFIDPPNR